MKGKEKKDMKKTVINDRWVGMMGVHRHMNAHTFSDPALSSHSVLIILGLFSAVWVAATQLFPFKKPTTRRCFEYTYLLY